MSSCIVFFILFFYFADIPYLRSLHLDRNPLQKVEANAFEMIPQLVSLDLSHCNIKRVAARAFAQLTSLEKLFLQHNQISELRQKTVESITGEQKPPGSMATYYYLYEEARKRPG